MSTLPAGGVGPGYGGVAGGGYPGKTQAPGYSAFLTLSILFEMI